MTPFVTQGPHWGSRLYVRWDLTGSGILPFYIGAHIILLEKLRLKIYVLPFRGMLTNSRHFLIFSWTWQQQGPSLILGKKIESVPKVITSAHFPTLSPMSLVLNTLFSTSLWFWGWFKFHSHFPGHFPVVHAARVTHQSADSDRSTWLVFGTFSVFCTFWTSSWTQGLTPTQLVPVTMIIVFFLLLVTVLAPSTRLSCHLSRYTWWSPWHLVPTLVLLPKHRINYSTRSPGSFWCKIVLETKMWGSIRMVPWTHDLISFSAPNV